VLKFWRLTLQTALYSPGDYINQHIAKPKAKQRKRAIRFITACLPFATLNGYAVEYYVNYNNAQYRVSTFIGSYQNNTNLFNIANMPWWGNQGFAHEFNQNSIGRRSDHPSTSWIYPQALSTPGPTSDFPNFFSYYGTSALLATEIIACSVPQCVSAANFNSIYSQPPTPNGFFNEFDASQNLTYVTAYLVGVGAGQFVLASLPTNTTLAGGTVIADARYQGTGQHNGTWVYPDNYQISNAGGTIEENGKTSVFSGVFSGTGNILISNIGVGGQITLSGISSYTGATTIGNGASVAVDGSIALSSGLTVNSGGMIGGNGNLPATTMAPGSRMAPGNSIGTLTINGNYSLNGGSLAIELQGPQNDQIVVTGNVNPFMGTASLISFAGGTAWPTFSYQIVTAVASAPFAPDNSLILDQSQITPSALLQLGTTLVQEADDNSRTFDVKWRPNNGSGAVASALQSLGIVSGNGLAAAGVFDSAFSALATSASGNANAGGAAIGTTGFTANQATAAGLSSEFVNRLGTLLAIRTGAQLQNAVSSITPESYAAFQSVGLNALRLQRETLFYQAGNCKDTGWIISSGARSKASSAVTPSQSESKRSLCAFAAGGNATASIHDSNGLSGYDSAIAGGYYGLEMQASKTWTVGLAYGYGTAALSNFGASGNTVSSTIHSGSLYGVYKPTSPWSVKAMLGYGNYSLGGQRNLIAIGNGTPISGNTNANGYTAAVLADYSLTLTKPAAMLPLVLKPMLGLAYGNYQQNGFSESGDAAMNLDVGGHTSQSLIATIGAELIAAIPLNQAKTQVLKPRLTVSYQADALADSNGNKSINASLPVAGGSMTSNGQNRGVNNFLVAGTLDYVIASRASLYAMASYEAFSTGSGFAYGGGVRISF